MLQQRIKDWIQIICKKIPEMFGWNWSHMISIQIWYPRRSLPHNLGLQSYAMVLGWWLLVLKQLGGLRFYFSQHRKSWENEGVTSGKREMGNLWKWKEDKEKVMAQIQKCESPKLDLDMFHFETWWNLKHFSTFHQPHLFGLTSYCSHQIFSTHTK